VASARTVVARRGLATHAGSLDDGGRRQLTGGGAPVVDGLGERAREVQHAEAKAVVHVAAAVGAWSGEDAAAASSAMEDAAMAALFWRACAEGELQEGQERVRDAW
jgi:hypothetical protein